MLKVKLSFEKNAVILINSRKFKLEKRKNAAILEDQFISMLTVSECEAQLFTGPKKSNLVKFTETLYITADYFPQVYGIQTRFIRVKDSLVCIENSNSKTVFKVHEAISIKQCFLFFLSSLQIQSDAKFSNVTKVSFRNSRFLFPFSFFFSWIG